MPHMKCVCFLQPSEDSLEALEAELREPKYGEYYLCQSVAPLEYFSRIRKKTDGKWIQTQILAIF